MKRLIAPLILLILALGTAARAQDAPPASVRINEAIPEDQLDEETGGRPVVVYFVALGEDGRPLPNPPLIEEGAAVVVDGASFPAALSRYEGESYVTFVVDNTRSMAGHLGAVNRAFLAALERKPDEMRLALHLFGRESAVQQAFTADPLALREAARGLVNTADTASCLYDAAYDAIHADSLAGALEATPQAPRAVVLISDGVNNGRCERYDDRHVDDLIELANARRVTFHSVRFGDIAAAEDARRLERLAESTGGAALTFQDEAHLTEELGRIMTGLNTQWQARAVVFSERDGPVSVNLEVRARGEGDATAPLPSTSTLVEIGRVTRRAKYLDIEGLEYLEEQQTLLVTLNAANLTDTDCPTLKLRDVETNETIEENSFCWRAGEAERQENLPAPGLVAERGYAIELYSDTVPLPEDKKPGDPLAVEAYTHGALPPPRTFDFRMTLPADSDYDRLQLELIGVTAPQEGSITYQVDITVDGTPQETVGPLILSDPSQPIIVDYYPEGEATEPGEKAEIVLVVTLTWPNGVSAPPKEKSWQLPLRPRAGTAERLTKALRANLIIPAGILLILTFALLYLAAVRRLNRLNPAAARSPVRGVTRVPEEGSGGAEEQGSGGARGQRSGGASDLTGGGGAAGARDGHELPDYRPAAAVAPPVLTAHPPLAATLRVLRAPDAGRQGEIAVINRFPFRIGREGCELTLGDGRTSRHHASIQQIGDQLVIIDKNSKNGTFLNDAPAPLTPGMRWPLQDGDRIRLGTTIELSLSTHPTGDSAPSGGRPTDP